MLAWAQDALQLCPFAEYAVEIVHHRVAFIVDNVERVVIGEIPAELDVDLGE